MYVFENMMYPLVVLGLVDVDVDEHDFEASDISETLLNRFLLKIGYKTCVIYVFGNFDKLAVALPLVVSLTSMGVSMTLNRAVQIPASDPLK